MKPFSKKLNTKLYMKISIIIPVYNVSGYIERCLLSVLNQTYNNIECILINDSTPDNSIEIVEKLIEEYSGKISIKIICHEENKGLSEARNTGIRHATGEYVYFLDSDDAITKSCIEEMVSLAECYTPDFVIGHVMEYNSKETEIKIPIAENFIVSNSQIAKLYSSHRWNMMACNKLINRKLILEHNLFFFPDIYHEDELWSFQLAAYACKMAICHNATYLYFRRPDSIMKVRSCKHFEDMFKIVEQCNLLVHTGCVTKRLYPQIKTLYWAALVELCKNGTSEGYKKSMAKQLLKKIDGNVKCSFYVYGLKDMARYFIMFLPSAIALSICKFTQKWS